MGIRSFFQKINDKVDRWNKEYDAECQQKLSAASEEFLNGYGTKFHCSDEQYKRFKRACSSDEIGKIVSINKYNLSCKIHSSKDYNTIYKTTLKDCSCPDFSEHKVPCKHMYKLALELGIITPEWDISGIPKDLKESIDSLDLSDLCAFLSLLKENYYSYGMFFTKMSNVPSALIDSELVNEYHSSAGYAQILDQNYSKNDIIAELSLAKNSYTPKASSTKRDMIQWIVENDEKLLYKLCKKSRCYIFPAEVSSYKSYILREYSQYLA